ncbi:hypothetical protein E1180_05695 [Roseibium denhamense]|uniref:LTXXQ motif family protein n=1 Tax=Roseibium denhamense TaxID=76305 RepID=A0ABY1PHQ8_9HYPH|nr:Spy/CpxP family protein refolding chaperone [Roseibium denhamense]MTI05006.1 hypothetical protein [Roseibium denhamense]SMP33196.1 LTXXQ motif family protein [Roseibium denhamense]
MPLKHLVIAAVLAPILATNAFATNQHGSHGHRSGTHTVGTYAGFEKRQIKSLSEDDIAEIRRGGGWGFALPAELNGWPGPAHLLELKDELDLTPEQVKQITAIHSAMKAQAIEAGEAFIEAEAALSEAFLNSDLAPDRLQILLRDAATARATLRYIHLSRHLETPPLLTEAQITAYKRLRGYQDDPCSTVPEGHDEAMWKKHNGCN